MSPTLSAPEQRHQPIPRERRRESDAADGRDHPDGHGRRNQKPRSQHPAGEGQPLAEAIPRARFEFVPAASHGMTIQPADQVGRRLRQFSESVEAGRAGARAGH